jgi:hypothetical protein
MWAQGRYEASRPAAAPGRALATSDSPAASSDSPAASRRPPGRPAAGGRRAGRQRLRIMDLLFIFKPADPRTSYLKYEYNKLYST